MSDIVIPRSMSKTRMDVSLEFLEQRLTAFEHVNSDDDRATIVHSMRLMINDMRRGVATPRIVSRCTLRIAKPTTPSSTMYTFTNDTSSPFRITRIHRRRECVRAITFPHSTTHDAPG